MAFHAGIDAGGTSFKCGIYTADWKLHASARVRVSSPADTVETAIAFFRAQLTPEEIASTSFGVASFGPLNVDPGSVNYGTILSTPKPGWSGVPLRAMLAEKLNAEIVIETDVNGALLAELSRGAARGCQSAAYITIGTGIGAGIFANGDFLGRPAHPEFGHIPVSRHAHDQNFESVCPFHVDCLEGLASAKAFEARYGSAVDLAEDHVGWQVEADYLAQACQSLYLTLRLQRIVLGGGLPQARHLIPLVRSAFVARLNQYTDISEKDAESLISGSAFGDEAGMLGAAMLGAGKTCAG